METDMVERTLKSCTSFPNAFFIATDSIHDDKVLGIVGCKQLTDSTCERTRLTVVPEARYPNPYESTLKQLITLLSDL